MKINMTNARIWPRTLGTLMGASALAVAIQVHAAKDDSFMKKAAEGGYFEVQASQLAEKNASSDQVKLLAHTIVTDHQQANDQLRQIALMKNVPLPTEPANKSELERLSGLKGKAFDDAYAKAMVKDHKNDIAEFLQEAKKGEDSAVKQFASQSLPTLQRHLHLAQQVQAQLGH